MADRKPGRHRYYLSLGSNIRPEENLRAAVRLLKQFGEVLACAPVYRSESFGDESQPDYLNTAVMVESTLSPDEFQQAAIRSVETALGRERSDNQYAARTIDIDIMLVDREVMQIEHRPIPSPELLEYAFVAVPLSLIAPDYIHPTEGRSLAQIAAGFPPNSVTLMDIDLLPS